MPFPFDCKQWLKRDIGNLAAKFNDFLAG